MAIPQSDPAPVVPVDVAREIEALHLSAFGWALACCRRDRQEAADVLQHSYCKVLSGQARFDGRSSLRTWLFGVIRLTARERRRWAFLRWCGLQEAEGSRDDRPLPDEALATKEAAAELSRSLARLAARQREVLHLVFYEGLSVAEAAEVMRVSVGAARQHYDRGKKRLLQEMQGKKGAGGERFA